MVAHLPADSQGDGLEVPLRKAWPIAVEVPYEVVLFGVGSATWLCCVALRVANDSCCLSVWPSVVSPCLPQAGSFSVARILHDPRLVS